jgi:hypothetical protein
MIGTGEWMPQVEQTTHALLPMAVLLQSLAT